MSPNLASRKAAKSAHVQRPVSKTELSFVFLCGWQHCISCCYRLERAFRDKTAIPFLILIAVISVLAQTQPESLDRPCIPLRRGKSSTRGSILVNRRFAFSLTSPIH